MIPSMAGSFCFMQNKNYCIYFFHHKNLIMRNRIAAFAVLLCCLAFSCNKTENKESLSSLDKALENNTDKKEYFGSGAGYGDKTDSTTQTPQPPGDEKKKQP